MKNQKRTIMGALDYSIHSLQDIKKTLMNFDHPNNETNWAVGGIMATLTSSLLKISYDIFLRAAQKEGANAHEDLKEIQDKFNEFMERMITNE